jgi:hypothetical protein
MMPKRRNSPGAGGYDFSASANPARPDTILWTPQALPSVVSLITAPGGLADHKLALPSGDFASLQARPGDDQILELRANRMRVHKLGRTDEPVAVLLPLDRLFDIRAAAALRLWRALTGRQPGPDPGTLTKDRRNRLILALRALDARLEKASYPEIATALFDTSPISKRDWISHELRDRTGRLVRLGFSMMRGGYRRLLLYPYRRRV